MINVIIAKNPPEDAHSGVSWRCRKRPPGAREFAKQIVMLQLRIIKEFDIIKLRIIKRLEMIKVRIIKSIGISYLRIIRKRWWVKDDFKEKDL